MIIPTDPIIECDSSMDPLIERVKPIVTLEGLVTHLRTEAERVRELNGSGSAAGHVSSTLSSPRIWDFHRAAEKDARVGQKIPSFASFRRPLRPIARLTARIVLYLSRFITDRQSDYNIALLRTVAALGEAVDRLEREALEAQRREQPRKGAQYLGELYLALQDRFRGSREEIMERLRIYLPILRDAGFGPDQPPVLDMGCGRGEWLELLRQEKWPALGVDCNSAMVAHCWQRGLDVIEEDALSYLSRVPDSSLAAVTGFHIVEHLSFEAFVKLIDETVRVLRPGGIAIFETPNPRNLLVSSYVFHLDPTHRNPLPSPMAKFVAEARGLREIEILELHRAPVPDTMDTGGSGLPTPLSEYLYGPQDYALVGRKT